MRESKESRAYITGEYNYELESSVLFCHEGAAGSERKENKDNKEKSGAVTIVKGI